MTPPADKDLVLDLRPGGTAEEIAKRFPPPAYFTAFIDGALVPDKAALLEVLAAALRFPSCFGRNWDALLDCLRSLKDFNPAGGYVLAVRNFDRFLAASPADRADFEDVFREAAAFLEEKEGVPLRLVAF